jgi:competence protein ComEA
MRGLSYVTGIVVCALALAAVPAAAQDKPAAARGVRAAAPTAANPVNLNTATAAQIAALPGIGEKVAQRIVEHRQKTGGFKKIEELMNVKGIGEKSFLKLKPLITVGDKPDRSGSKQ